MSRTYTCKRCGEKYHRSKHETCPKCGAESESPKRKGQPQDAVPTVEASESVAEIVEEEEFVVDTVNYFAEVAIFGDRATMQFRNQVVAGKSVFCPRCNKRQFDVTLLLGTMTRRCDRCKLDITMIFS